MTAIATSAPAPAAASTSGRSTGDRLAGICALVSAPIGFLSLIAVLAAADWDAEIFDTPTTLLAQGSSAADGVRWAMVLDLIGYYALMVPALLALRAHLARRRPDLARLSATSGLAYLITGAVGAVVLAVTWPLALEQIGAADPAQAAGITASFEAITEAVVSGLWNLFGSAAAAVWLLVTARLVWPDRRGFAVLSIVVGAAGAIDALSVAADLESVGAVSLQVYLYGLLLWAGWLGVLLLRGGLIVDD